jgi:hypothetical protein
MQKMFAGTNPNCAVRIPITQTMALLAPANTQPCQSFLPSITVDMTVSTHEI